MPFPLQLSIKSQINQVFKGKIMINIKNPNQLNIFDPWDFLTPKRRKMLDNSWPGLFREHILPSILVHKVAKYFDKTFGRPTKELYAMIGALVLQQTLDLTDEEATMSEYDRRTGVKHLRVRGLKAVRFCATLKALGVNIFRAAAVRAAKMMPVEGLCEA